MRRVSNQNPLRLDPPAFPELWVSGGGGLERSDSFPAADGCTASDAFDLAAIYWHDHSALAEIAQSPAITDHVVSSALNRLNLAKHQYQADIRSLINASPRGEEIMGRLVGLRWRGWRKSGI